MESRLGLGMLLLKRPPKVKKKGKKDENDDEKLGSSETPQRWVKLDPNSS